MLTVVHMWCRACRKLAKLLKQGYINAAALMKPHMPHVMKKGPNSA